MQSNEIVEITFDIDNGLEMPRDHQYALYSALKNKHSGWPDKDWYFIPVQGDQISDGLMSVQESSLKVRCPKRESGEVVEVLNKEFLRISEHIIQLGEANIKKMEPSPVVKSSLIIITSDDSPRGVRESEFCLHVGKRIGARFGHLDYGIEVGPRRRAHVSGSRLFGHRVTLKGISDEECFDLYQDGVGQKQNMGFGQFRSVYG